MADLKAAALAASNLAKQYRSVLLVADALDELGDLDNAKAYAERLLAEANKARIDAEVSRDAAIAEAKAEADKLPGIIEANQKCIAGANERAAAALAEAKAQAEEIVASARNEAEGIDAESDKSLVEANSKLADLKDTIAVEQAKLDEIKAEFEQFAAVAAKLKGE